jgi:putative membrane protein
MLDTLVIVMAVIHVYIFCLETILWGKPSTNRAFGVTDNSAQVLRGLMFNQGFYNLFLAIALLVGFFWSTRPGSLLQAQTIKDYAALSILGAGLVLWMSDPRLIKPAMIQAGPAVIYWILRLTTST